MSITKSLLLLLFLPTVFNGIVSGSICSGPPASPNWYGSVGYPPYFTRNSEEKCDQKYELSRCEQSAVMKDGSSEFTTDENGMEICTLGTDCWPTKQNCNDTLVCSELLSLKDELLEGGHNIVCRHEKTYWQRYTGEVKNCHVHANCMDSEVKPTQRQLQPYGWDSAKAFADAFREMNIPIGKEFSSPFTRCAQHAELFSDDVVNEERLELLYMGGWKEVLKVNNITEINKPNALKWQAYNLRNFAGKKPADGTNNIMVTHGFNIKLGFGLAVDEGYCIVLKPSDQQPSLFESVGTLTVANKDFTFDSDSFPVEVITRMSPESAIHMQTCQDVQTASMSKELSKSNILAYDSNNDMKITREEFTASNDAANSDEAFSFLKSIQPSVLGKSLPSAESIELGVFFHANWGWREFAASSGDISLPWRGILENTIGVGGASVVARVRAFDHANAILSSLAKILSDSSNTYTSIELMKEHFLDCNPLPKSQARKLADCSVKTHLTESGGKKYFPIGPGDGGASASTNSIFGSPLAYPSVWTPDFYDSNYLKVASCIVVNGDLEFLELLELMGCRKKRNNKILKKGRKRLNLGSTNGNK